MSDPNFDPYHKWLGIPPDEQPANHYRLLGLELFEMLELSGETDSNKTTAKVFFW